MVKKPNVIKTKIILAATLFAFTSSIAQTTERKLSIGINSGKGINMANASFSGAVEAAQNAVTDFAGAGRDLFSMESITSPNKYISSNTMAKINKLDVASKTTLFSLTL